MPEVHRPWLAAVATGLITVVGNRAVRGSRLDDPLTTWWADPQRHGRVHPAEAALTLLRLLDEVDAWNRAGRWFGDRTRDQIVAELVPSAADASPAERVTAVTLLSGLGDEAVAALRATEPLPDNLSAHALVVAHQHNLAPRPGIEDLVWLATERGDGARAHDAVAPGVAPLPHPECVAGKGGDPIDPDDPEEPEEPAPFDAAAINARLRKVARPG